MRKLVLLAVMATPAVASAQWTGGTVFPDSTGQTTAEKRWTLKAHDNPHGIAVDREGKVWISPYYARAGDSVFVPALGAKRISNAIHVYNADGTRASFSPLMFLDYPDGTRDTLGGYLLRNATNALAWDTRSGRGLALDNEGNIVAGMFNSIFRINSSTGAGISRVKNTVINGTDSRGLAGPAVDRNGRVYVTGVFPGDALVVFNRDMTFRENVVTPDEGFTRVSGTSVTGDSVYHFAYDKKLGLRYVRPDEFSSYNATPDTVLRGLAMEAFVRDPANPAMIWVGAGSPNDVPAAPYLPNRWYAFMESEIGQNRPVIRDSIVWNNTPTSGRPRGIGIAPDGKTAYVIQFSNVSEPFAVRRYTKLMGNAVDGYGRWVPDDVLLTVGPNPSRGALNVRYRGLAGAPVRIEMFDAAGRRVATLVDGVQPDGEQTASFDTSNLSAGTYYVRFTGGNATVTRPVSVLH